MFPRYPYIVLALCRTSDLSIENVRLDKKGRLTIPAGYRERLGLGEEVALFLEEDHPCRTATAEEFGGASRRLAQEIARRRDRPIGFRFAML